MRLPRHSHLCIVPPHVLMAIAENGTPSQREKALRTLTEAARVRSQREEEASTTQRRAEALSDAIHRVVYDAEHSSQLPGTRVRSEGDPPTGDPAVDEAYDGAGATYDLFHDVYGRNSVDDRGMVLNSTVHFRTGYDNAFWDGRQMVYGDGDEDLPESERLFNRFTASVDVIGHELTHGVTQYEAALVYQNEPGALNESISDVFGILVKQYLRGESALESDWLVGGDLLTANVQGTGLRSLKAPGTAYDDPVLGKDPQPGHMRDYKAVPYDNGGVHINSGIPNRAFYVVARELGGNAWEQAGQIWYVALRDRLRTNSNFLGAARHTHAAAAELFGEGSREQRAVHTGWLEVGIDLTAGHSEPGDGDGLAGCWSKPLTALKTLWNW